MGNLTSNAVLELIHQVLVNLVRTLNIKETYVDKDNPWSVILAASEIAILSTTNRLKGYSPGLLVFVRDIILWIKQKVYWELIRQQKQTQIHKDNILKTSKIVYHDYKVGDKVILNNHAAYNMKRHIMAHL